MHHQQLKTETEMPMMNQWQPITPPCVVNKPPSWHDNNFQRPPSLELEYRGQGPHTEWQGPQVEWHDPQEQWVEPPQNQWGDQGAWQGPQNPAYDPQFQVHQYGQGPVFGDDREPYRGGQPNRRYRATQAPRANPGRGAKRGREPAPKEVIDLESPLEGAALADQAAADAKYANDRAHRAKKFGTNDRVKNLYRAPDESDFRLRDERNKADLIYEGVVGQAKATGLEPPSRREWNASRPPIGSGVQGKSARGGGNANRGRGDHTQA